MPLLTKNIPILKKEGTLNYILKNWKKLINDPTIFRDSARERFTYISQQEQSKTPRMTIISKEETGLIYQEIRKILSKEAVSAAYGGSDSELIIFGREKEWRRIFVKLMKVSISLLRKLCIRINIYLDNMLLMVASGKELLIAWHKVIFLLQNLQFLINAQKFIPTLTLEFLGVLKRLVQSF